MSTSDVEELVLRIQGRSGNYDSGYDPFLYKEWLSGSQDVEHFNSYIDSLHTNNGTTAVTSKMPRCFIHANVMVPTC